MEKTVNFIKTIEDAISLSENMRLFPEEDFLINLKPTIRKMRFDNCTKNPSDSYKTFFNFLVKSETRLLQTGIKRGCEFISALYQNKFDSAIVIDDFGGESFADDRIGSFMLNCDFNNLQVNEDFLFFKKDPLSVDDIKDVIKKVNLFFHFGDSYYSTHKKLLPYYKECLDDTFIFVTHSWNKEPVRSGTMSSIDECKFNLLEQWTLYDNTFICLLQK